MKWNGYYYSGYFICKQCQQSKWDMNPYCPITVCHECSMKNLAKAAYEYGSRLAEKREKKIIAAIAQCR